MDNVVNDEVQIYLNWMFLVYPLFDTLQINSIDRLHFQLTLKWIFWKLYGKLSGNELKGDANIPENLFLSIFS